jgi:tRNA pseudouridine65 synthase
MDAEPDLEMLYRDDHFVAIHKPAGLLVHRSPIAPRETRFALQMVRDRIGQRVYPVHRLDRPTSGVLLFALDPETARATAELFKAGRVRKSYLAVVRGYIDESGTIDYPLKEIEDRRIPGQAAASDYDAITDFKRLATVELPCAVDRYPTARYSLVRLHPRTGRRHQLRRHMRHLRHPVIGDTRYGTGAHNRFFREHFGCHRLLLAATELRFRHPSSEVETAISAEVKDVFLKVLKRLEIY